MTFNKDNIMVLEPVTIDNQTLRKEKTSRNNKASDYQRLSCSVNRMVHFSNQIVLDLRLLAT